MPNSKQIVYLSQAQYAELIANGSITVNGVTVNYDENDLYVTPQAEPVTDVQVNSASVVQNGVANVPIASSTVPGAVLVDQKHGITLYQNKLAIADAIPDVYKVGASTDRAVTPYRQHLAVFYGLARVAGANMANIANVTVGVYPDAQKAAIQNMLGVTDLISTEETTTATAAHALNSTFMMNGKLHRATAAIAIGDAVEVGTNCEVVKVEDVFVKNTDYASGSDAGIVKINPEYGIGMFNNYLMLNQASADNIKAGNNSTKAVSAFRQHEAVFYGLSKIAGIDLKNETVTLGTYPETSKTAIRSLIGAAAASDIPSVPVQDVQVAGTSVLSNGVANVPQASSFGAVGVVKVNNYRGLGFENDGALCTLPANDGHIKSGVTGYAPIVPITQHVAAFYGLAKAAGADEKDSTLSVGTYTETAKSAIRNMLGAASPDVIAIQDTQPTNTDTKVWLPETQAAGIQVPTMEDMQNYVQKTDYAGATGTGIYGIVRISAPLGVGIDNGYLYTTMATDALIKAGENNYNSISPKQQHKSVFYGLAKAAGDTTQSQSDNAVGTYTADASAAIRTMLGTPSNADLSSKADKTDTVLESTLSRGRLEESEVGEGSLAFGYDVEASGDYSHAEGQETYAYGVGSHTEGNITVAVGDYSHAEGDNTEADGLYSHAEGSGSIAVGDQSHASGLFSSAYGENSFTAGAYTIASGDNSFVHGQYNVEDNYFSWPTWESGIPYTVGDKVKRYRQSMDEPVWTGYICTTDNNDIEFDVTKWDKDGSMNYAEMVGNGTAENIRSNAYALDWSGNGRFAGNVYVNCNDDSTGGTMLPYDVQVNGVSVLQDGVANVPVASSNTFGAVKLGNGITASNGFLVLANPTDNDYKTGGTNIKAVVPSKQHHSVFYGLATAAGDTTQSASSNAVGTYTAEAKSAIQSMFGIDLSSIAAEVEIPLVETVSGTTPSITGQPNTRYVCGEVSTISITPPSTGSIDVFFDSGSTPTVITVPNTVKWPSWFDATALEADTTYEILITDGVYGSVMTWAN